MRRHSRKWIPETGQRGKGKKAPDRALRRLQHEGIAEPTQPPADLKATTFNTPIGLLRMCTLPQGATNSVAQFIRVITRILFDLIPDVCRPFVDDIAVKAL